MDRNAAKRLGRSTQKWVPDVTWSPLPQRMLELLVKIAEVETGVATHMTALRLPRLSHSHGLGTDDLTES
jgi:hypothetical protein